MQVLVHSSAMLAAFQIMQPGTVNSAEINKSCGLLLFFFEQHCTSERHKMSVVFTNIISFRCTCMITDILYPSDIVMMCVTGNVYSIML